MLRADNTLAGAIAPVPVAAIALGYGTGIRIANDGTKFLRSDTQGGWRLLPGGDAWELVATAATMLPAERYPADLGCYDVALHPVNPNHAAMICMGALYLTVNFLAPDASAIRWRKVAALGDLPMDGLTGHSANRDPWRVCQDHMDFDPVNHQVLWFAPADRAGLVKVSNVSALHNATVTIVGAGQIPMPNAAWPHAGAHSCLAFDPSSGVTGGQTNRLYVHSAGSTNLYSVNTSNGVVTAIPGAPVCLRQLRVQPGTGTVFALDVGSSLDNATVRRYAAGVWSSPIVAVTVQKWSDVICHPTDASKVWLLMYSGLFSYSSDGGATFSNWTQGGFGSGQTPPFTREEDTQIQAYLQFTNYDNAGGRYDPSTGKVWLAHGGGAAFCQPPEGTMPFVWYGKNKGIFNLVGMGGKIDPLGRFHMVCHDKPYFRFLRGGLNTPPAYHGPGSDQPLRHAQTLDFASDDPNYVMQHSDKVWHSLQGGAEGTWAEYPHQIAGPVGQDPSQVAVGTKGNAVLIGRRSEEGNTFRLLYSAQFGAWQPIDFGSPALNTAASEMVWVYNWRGARWILQSDKERVNTFYAYCVGNLGNDGTPHASDAAFRGVWKFVISGNACTATRVHDQRISRTSLNDNLSYLIDYYAGKLVLGPGRSAWFAPGGNSSAKTKNPTQISFTPDIDAANSWVALPNAPTEVHALDLGAAAPGAAYKTIYAYAEQEGLFICRNFNPALPQTATWTLAADYPVSGSLDIMIGGAADPMQHGTFVGTGGNSGLLMATAYRFILG